MIQSLRDRSIAVRARNIKVPADLNDPKRIAVGAGLYTEMCSGCHLGPGLEKTEISQGLYPQAPELYRTLGHSPAQEFWMIKHGVKMTAMPAWGRTHSDELMWDMVAFVRQLPSMSPEQYQAAIKSAPEDHDAMMRDMPGMSNMPMPAGKP
jgi:mono/diheme cytochrome c family protein